MSIPYIFLTLFHIIRFPRTPCTNIISIPKTISYIVNTPRGVSKASRLMLFMPRTLGRHTFYPWCGRRSYLLECICPHSDQSGTDHRLRKWSFMDRDESIRVLSEPCSVRIRLRHSITSLHHPFSHLPAPSYETLSNNNYPPSSGELMFSGRA